MVCYSFLVGLFHPLLHAGLSRRLRSLTVATRSPSRERERAVSPKFTAISDSSQLPMNIGSERYAQKYPAREGQIRSPSRER